MTVIKAVLPKWGISIQAIADMFATSPTAIGRLIRRHYGEAALRRYRGKSFVRRDVAEELISLFELYLRAYKNALMALKIDKEMRDTIEEEETRKVREKVMKKVSEAFEAVIHP